MVSLNSSTWDYDVASEAESMTYDRTYTLKYTWTLELTKSGKYSASCEALGAILQGTDLAELFEDIKITERADELRLNKESSR